MNPKYSLIDFTSTPVGGEAIPPEDSEYHRALHLPSPEHEDEPWVLLRGEGPTTVADRVNHQYLVVAGFAPAEQLTMNFEAATDRPGGEKIRVRVSVDFALHTGLYAWPLAAELSNLVPAEDVFHELVRRGDRSAEALLAEGK